MRNLCMWVWMTYLCMHIESIPLLWVLSQKVLVRWTHLWLMLHQREMIQYEQIQFLPSLRCEELVNRIYVCLIFVYFVIAIVISLNILSYIHVDLFAEYIIISLLFGLSSSLSRLTELWKCLCPISYQFHHITQFLPFWNINWYLNYI